MAIFLHYIWQRAAKYVLNIFGWNLVAGADISAIIEGYQQAINSPPTKRPKLYGDGKASLEVVRHLIEAF